MAYLHGIQTKTKARDSVIQLNSSTVIGIIGISDIDIPAPILLESADDERLGNGSIKDAVEQIETQAKARMVVISFSNNFAARLQKLEEAEAQTGLKLNLLVQPEVENIVNAKLLEAMALKLGAVAIVESSGTNLSTHKAFAAQLTNSYVIAGGVTVGESDYGGSATAAGVIARTDKERGFHVSPSNKLVMNASGSKDNISFITGQDCLANQLNEQNLACFINRDGKCFLWGSRLASGTHIQKHRAEVVIKATIEEQTIDMVDKNINSGSVKCLVIKIQNFLDQLASQRIIAGGEVHLSEAQSELAGHNKLAIDYTLGFFDSAEQITYSVSITNDYNKKIA